MLLEKLKTIRYVVARTANDGVVVENECKGEVELDKKTQEDLLSVLKRIDDAHSQATNNIEILRKAGVKFGKINYSWKPKDRNII